MKTIGVIGGNGFVGCQICKEVLKHAEYKLITITRSDDLKKLVTESDIIIHAANSSKRYYAENNPSDDFIESVEKTALIKKYARNKKLILVSSISARTQLDSVYGRNRRACELIVGVESSLIIRLGPMFGEGKCQGALHDILNNKKVYVSGKTRYAYVDVNYNANKIIEFVGDENIKGVVELGACEDIKLDELAHHLGSTSKFSGKDDTQIPLTPCADAPNIDEVINFAKSISNKS